MSEADVVALAERCRKVMVDHLKTKGYPDMPIGRITEELTAMWKALDREGLTVELRQYGLDFRGFTRLAEHQAMAAMTNAASATFDKFRADFKQRVKNPKGNK